MRQMISFFVRNPIWVTVLLFGLIFFGLISLSGLRFSFFPELEPDIITVQVVYPGAAPGEVAEGMILKIEENLDGLDGVDRVTSTAHENGGTVTVEITDDAHIDKVVNDVKNAVDRISSFPADAEKPVIYEQKFRTRALSLVLFGETDLYNLKHIAEEFRDELLATDEISQVAVDGLPELEFSIEVTEADLRRYQLTFDEITAAVRHSNVNISGGKLETSDEEVLIRAWGRGYFTKELLDIPVRGNPDGSVLRLGDIGVIKEQWEDIPDRQYYNGHSAVVLNIDQTEQEDILKIAEVAKAMMVDFNEREDKLNIVVLDDRTIPLNQRIELLVRNGLIGLALVIMSLGLFLNLRLSWWVAIGIPFSFAGMFIVAGFSGITINVISLFGMILVVGILVDDAIVVGENIFSHYERGKTAMQAAIDGTMEVVAPVTTSILTTVVAFMPFFFLQAMLGKFIWQMAIVVVASLLFSLIEAFFILPSHLAHSKGLRPHKKDPVMRQRVERGIKWFTHRVYGRTLLTAMRYKWISITTPIALVLLTVGLVVGGHIGFTFFPFIDGDTLPVNVSLVSGKQEADTEALLRRVESAIWQVNDEIREERIDGKNVVIGVNRVVGHNTLGESGSHTGMLTAQLLDGEERNMDSYLIANQVRDKMGPVPEAEKMTFGRAGHWGKPVSISLLGNDAEQLNRARDLLVAELKQMSVLKDITDTNAEGRRELNIKLKPRAHALGLTLDQVAGQVRQGFFGREIQRIQRGRDEIKVWVRYRDVDRSSLGMVDRMRIRTPDGGDYPFSALAEYSIERGITQIDRLDRRREVKVEANLADVEADLPPILAEIRDEIVPPVVAQVQGVIASFEGQSRDQAKLGRSMATAFPIALLGMLVLMILVFRSYAQALLIFGLIPLGTLGAVWGHGIQGLQLNMLSMFGVIALSGIVINDSIVLIDKVNRNLREKQTVWDAVYNAGIQRLRPILLTTITTALGLAPLILETSRQAQFLIPMAVSVAYGMVFGTVILLLILPAGFLCFNSVRVKFWSLLGPRTERERVTPENVEPAVRELTNRAKMEV